MPMYLAAVSIILGATAKALSDPLPRRTATCSSCYVSPVLPSDGRPSVRLGFDSYSGFPLYRRCHEGDAVIELFHDFTPQLCRNFLQLVEGNQGTATDRYPLRYTRTRARVEQGNVIAGDVTGGALPRGRAAVAPVLRADQRAPMHLRSQRGVVCALSDNDGFVGSEFMIVINAEDKRVAVPMGQVVTGIDVLEAMCEKQRRHGSQSLPFTLTAARVKK